MTEPAPRPVTATWVKILLALSLAFNLGILGIVAGARMKDGRGDKDGLPRDVSFGPFSEALSRQDRQALREALLSKAPEFRAAREAARAEFATLVTALRADPFDPGAVREALAAIEQRNASRLELGRSMIETRIFDMAEAERLAFADRLAKGLGTKARPAP